MESPGAREAARPSREPAAGPAPRARAAAPHAGASASLPFPRLRRLLLQYYERHARQLPWRGERDAYRVWVSEVMLQQTRVETAIPYYQRWIERFPDVRSLADSSENAVLEAWSGLGYYTRARNLLRAALLIRDRHGGKLPARAAELIRLPGVGRYTAGAVASIAFGEPAPAVDGNARRVLCRLFDTPSPARIARLAQSLVDPRRPGDFNQALMDLGATVCTPRAPHCGECPLTALCRARAQGTVEERARRSARKHIQERDFAVAVLADERGRVLLVRRPDVGLLAGLWAFPERELLSGQAPASAARQVARALEHVPLGRARTLPAVRHAFTHLRARYIPVLLRADSAAHEPAGRRWLDPARLGSLPVPAAQRRIAQSAAEALASGGRPTSVAQREIPSSGEERRAR